MSTSTNSQASTPVVASTLEPEATGQIIIKDSDIYFEKDVFSHTLKYATGFGAFGLLMSAVQNALSRHEYGAAGVITRTGKTITGYALIGGIFAGTESILANARKTDDWVNGAVAGCTAGLTAGIRVRSYPVAFGACFGMATLLSVYEWAGQWKGLTLGMTDERITLVNRMSCDTVTVIDLITGSQDT
ncbi:16708_t:CDS:2 [Cetraspora pellucida]|uniref:16708_t:CDS:1 n=1 Tax=Cetraspora pellucida TaxID=1433469 RepID=A0ACA9NMY3_9GLOM|nr:16708_t:CDS:2 [Cetraspora pellucida]